MRIEIRAKPGAREEQVEKIDEVRYVVAVKEPPVAGRANAAIVRALAAYFGVSVSRVRIVSGYTFRQKVVEIA